MLTTTPLIEARNLHKSFGTLEVLKGVNLCVQQGEILAILKDQPKWWRNCAPMVRKCNLLK